MRGYGKGEIEHATAQHLVRYSLRQHFLENLVAIASRSAISEQIALSNAVCVVVHERHRDESEDALNQIKER